MFVERKMKDGVCVAVFEFFKSFYSSKCLDSSCHDKICHRLSKSKVKSRRVLEVCDFKKGQLILNQAFAVFLTGFGWLSGTFLACQAERPSLKV